MYTIPNNGNFGLKKKKKTCCENPIKIIHMARTKSEKQMKLQTIINYY